MFQRIKSDLYQAIIKDLEDRKIVDDLYLEGKLPFCNIIEKVPSKENLDFDYSSLRLVRNGDHTDEGDGIHLFVGAHWKLPYKLVRNGHQTFINRPSGEIGGFVRKLLVKVTFDQVTGEPDVEVIEIEQAVYTHP